MWPFKKRYPKRRDLSLPDVWTLAQGEHEGAPLIPRINTAAGPLAGHPEFKHRVGVAIPLREPDEQGFPSEEEGAELAEIEETLARSLLANLESLLVLVITTGGMREFVFYTANPSATESKLRTITEEVTSHEVQAYIEPDKEWIGYLEFSGRVA